MRMILILIICQLKFVNYRRNAYMLMKR